MARTVREGASTQSANTRSTSSSARRDQVRPRSAEPSTAVRADGWLPGGPGGRALRASTRWRESPGSTTTEWMVASWPLG